MTAVRRRKAALLRSFRAALLVVCVSAAAGEGRAGEIVALVHEGNPTTEEISLHRLRLLYALYQRSWRDGLRVHVVLPPPGSEALDFLVKKVFRKSFVWQLDRYYVQAVFQQMVPSRPPHLLARDSIEFVRSEPGAIALVEREEVVVQRGFRILSIVGD